MKLVLSKWIIYWINRILLIQVAFYILIGGRAITYGSIAGIGDIQSGLYHKVRAWAFWICIAIGGIGLLGVLPDLDHLVDGMARQTHLLAVLVACIPLCLYVALCSRHAKSRRLR
jgi:hypothetical protein